MEECDNFFSESPEVSKKKQQSANPFAVDNAFDQVDANMYNTMRTPSSISKSSAKRAQGNDFERLLFADGAEDSEEEPEDFEWDCASLTAKLRGFNLADPFMYQADLPRRQMQQRISCF